MPATTSAPPPPSSLPAGDPPPGARASHDQRWWIALIVVVAGSFAVLLWLGLKADQEKPPIPAQVVTASGQQVMTGENIVTGQKVWQSIGGQQIGSVWGHGAYAAPDWTADMLHRDLLTMLDAWARAEGAASYDALGAEQAAALRARLTQDVRTSAYDPATGVLTISDARYAAYQDSLAYYTALFRDGHEPYAIPAGAVRDPHAARDMVSFFWWSTWAASANRPGTNASYTQNWPHEPLIGNEPTPGHVLWSLISLVLLLGGIATMAWYHTRHADPGEDPGQAPVADPLLGYRPTPSQQATLKYFFVVGALFVLQILAGIVSAHYGVEGGGLYGIPLDQWLPYTVVRTWHTQLGILWIATAWLATGLYVAPAVGGHEPRYQRLGVNLLFGALIVVVAGSLTGEWLSIRGELGYGTTVSFWFGTTGWEYIDLARFWQIGLITGLAGWLFLMWRGMAPALRASRGGPLSPTAAAPLAAGSQRSLVAMLLVSCLAIASFFGAAFGAGHGNHMSIAEYWRWWVVHLWVEGFFEVFATVVIAFLFSRLGLIRAATATTATLAATVVFLLGGIIGTGHHLYFSGSPEVLTALGACFSALEVVPLPASAAAAGARMGRRIQMGDLLLRLGVVLEHARRGRLRLPHQPADLAVLRPGAQPHPAARAHRPVRGVRDAGHRAHAVLRAQPHARPGMERGPDQDRVLVPQRGPAGDGVAQPAPRRTAASPGRYR